MKRKNKPSPPPIPPLAADELGVQTMLLGPDADLFEMFESKVLIPGQIIKLSPEFVFSIDGLGTPCPVLDFGHLGDVPLFGDCCGHNLSGAKVILLRHPEGVKAVAQCPFPGCGYKVWLALTPVERDAETPLDGQGLA